MTRIKFLATAMLLLMVTSALAQSINYKALIKDGSGNVVANDLIAIQFQILQGGAMTNVYQETHAPTTDANGIVIVNIGNGSVDSGVYADIDWALGEHYLNVQINTGGGLTDMGTTQFMAVPYALNAATKIDELSDAKSDADGSSIFLGVDAGVNDDGSNNVGVGIGRGALFNNTSGWGNTGIGEAVLVRNTIGNRNTAIGFSALFFNISGQLNTAIGVAALNKNTGGENTAIGSDALFNNTSGGRNTAIGNQALTDLTSGSNNIGVGYDAQPSAASVSNEVTVGNSNNNVYRMFAASWTNASDKHLKHGIQNIPVGLDLVLKLRPVAFVYNNANNEQKTFGFIAQEVKEAVKQSNLEDNILVSPLDKQYLGLRTTELISVLTKAIQEQQEIIESQNSKIKTLTSALVENKEENTIQNKSIEKLLKRVEQLELATNQ